MSDLISRDAAIESIKSWFDKINLNPDIFIDGNITFPTRVLCKDCKHYKQSAVTDRKMCFRKDADGVQVCYDFLPYDSCTYGERREDDENN